MGIRVILADDHDIVRAGIRHILLKNPGGVEIVGEAKNGLEAIELVEGLSPDLLILDLTMPEMDGIEVARRLRVSNTPVRILILSAHNDRTIVRELLRDGVDGYITKDEAVEAIYPAIQGVMQGECWLSPSIAKLISNSPSNS